MAPCLCARVTSSLRWPANATPPREGLKPPRGVATRVPLSRRGRALVALGVALLVLSAGLALATRAGWVAAGPPDLPVQAYAPTRADDPRTWQTLDHGTFGLHGATYEAELLGFPQMSGTGLHALVLRIVQTGGDGARVWPASLALETDEGRGGGNAFYEYGGERAPQVSQGAWEARVGTTFDPGDHAVRAEARLHVYREAAVGLVREEDLLLRLEFPVRVEAPPAS